MHASNTMTARLTFPHVAWKAKYQRNNKPNGLKNLRCFPDCSQQHKETGFCGQAIQVTVNMSPARPNMMVFGELGVADDPRWLPGMVVSQNDMAALLRSEDEEPSPEMVKVQPLFRAHNEGGDVYKFALSRKGWHYGWVGSKHTGEVEHAFLVYICVPYGLNYVQILATFKSPRFTMFCRRRHNTVKEEEKVARAKPLLPSDLVFETTLLPNGTLPVVPLPYRPAQPMPVPKKRASASKKRKTHDSPSSTLSSQLLQPRHDSNKLVDEKLVRVLSAIAKLDELQTHEKPPSSPSKPQPQQDEYAWFEPISDLFVGAADLYDDVADIFNLDELVDLDEPRSRAVEVITALAHYFVLETELTEAIHSKKLNSYSSFLEMVQVEISRFLQEHFAGMTIDNLDALLRGEDYLKPVGMPTMRSAFDTLVSAAVSRAPSPEPVKGVIDVTPPLISFSQRLAGMRVLSSAAELDQILPPGIKLSMLLTPKPLAPGQLPPDVAGTWLRPEEATLDMEKMREKRDMDWMQRQLLAQMEKRFELIQPNRDEVVVHLARKLLSPGIVHYKLDAVERPFVMTSPLGSTPAAKTACAWGVGPVCIFRNAYNDHERMSRCNWKGLDGNLWGVYIYESVAGEGWGSATSTSSSSSGHEPKSAPWEINRLVLVWCTPVVKSSPVFDMTTTTTTTTTVSLSPSFWDA